MYEKESRLGKMPVNPRNEDFPPPFDLSISVYKRAVLPMYLAVLVLPHAAPISASTLHPNHLEQRSSPKQKRFSFSEIINTYR